MSGQERLNVNICVMPFVPSSVASCRTAGAGLP